MIPLRAMVSERIPTMLETAMRTHKRVSESPRESLSYPDLTILVMGDEIIRLGRIVRNRPLLTLHK